MKKLVVSRKNMPISLFRTVINIIVVSLLLDRLIGTNNHTIWIILSILCGVIITVVILLKILEQPINLFDFTNIKESDEDKKNRTKVFDRLKNMM